MQIFANYFPIKPWLFTLCTNVVLLLVIISLGFGWMIYFNSINAKLYGDHCVYDGDCALGMNYICQHGVCNCTSTTYYHLASDGCGNLKLNL